MEVLEKYNVFAYASEIARIVRAASQEEQLDFMVSDLRTTWTEQKMSIKMCHGIPTVTDFSQLHTTVSASIVTLKELGQSRYSSQMKDSLLYWCDVVEKAERFVWLISKAQALWMYQEVPMTSMLLGGRHPSKFSYFQLLRKKFAQQMTKVAAAEVLISAFGNQDDYLQLTDITLGFKKTERLVDSVLWSLRSDSPRLFFLTRTDLLSMLFEAHNDLPAMYRYIAKIYPAISSLVLVEDTELTITKKGYHPEIEGIISKDGEKIVFAEVMRVRLGVEHWVKYMGIHLRFTLRSQLRAFFRQHNRKKPTILSELVEFWKKISMATQMQLLVTHTVICHVLETKMATPLEIDEALITMKEFTLATIKSHGFNEIRKKREVAKLMLIDYYKDLKPKKKCHREFLDSFLVRYKEFRVSAFFGLYIIAGRKTPIFETLCFLTRG